MFPRPAVAVKSSFAARGAGRNTGVARLVCVLLGSLLALAVPAGASASITLGTNAQRPALRVDAQGNAEVSWTAGGVRRYVLVPPTGRVFPGRRLAGRDVSRSSTAVTLAFRRVLRRTPDGRLWALQAWRVQPGGPVKLRFSRWRGAPPKVTIEADQRLDGNLVTGRATFAGRPVPLYSPTPEGKRIRSYVYVERSTVSTWSRLAGVRTQADGSFRLYVPPDRLGLEYRALLPGPNIGVTFAPDAASPAVRSVTP
jgi:hypothetical protein